MSDWIRVMCNFDTLIDISSYLITWSSIDKFCIHLQVAASSPKQLVQSWRAGAVGDNSQQCYSLLRTNLPQCKTSTVLLKSSIAGLIHSLVYWRTRKSFFSIFTLTLVAFCSSPLSFSRLHTSTDLVHDGRPRGVPSPGNSRRCRHGR